MTQQEKSPVEGGQVRPLRLSRLSCQNGLLMRRVWQGERFRDCFGE
jgi:hypothetical protein